MIIFFISKLDVKWYMCSCLPHDMFSLLELFQPQIWEIVNILSVLFELSYFIVAECNVW